ncbi:MAG: hypothetical protein J1F18_07295 [Lachnospiraceae bacterium]|nr:hypothetical protein [Lachnospiraceae bacterium]
MAKTLYDAMKKTVERTLEGVPLEIVSISNGESVNEETGEVSKFVRVEVEVPKGFDDLSKCRFQVKIPDGKLKVTETQLEEDEYIAKFSGLAITYVDNRGTVYFKSDDYNVAKVGV